MQRSKVDVLVHFVWATRRREALLVPPVEALVYGCIHSEAVKSGCDVVALGGMPDHVHLLARVPATVPIAHIMQQVKGVSSTVARGSVTVFPGWQDNYAAVSVSPRDRSRVIAYIAAQKKHHAAGTVWSEAEETGAPIAQRQQPEV